ncbi:Hypothetical protein A7982_10277 [Minicystis rosea]|nr:Hypothetical protein A7982_10277 [Minicystis rosea]
MLRAAAARAASAADRRPGGERGEARAHRGGLRSACSHAHGRAHRGGERAEEPLPEGMAFIPGGEFIYGRTSKEKVKVEVKPYCLDITEVPTDAYMACVKSGKCDNTRLTVCDPSTAGKDDRGKLPMVCVDFPQAERYCAAQDKRLPSTEEWEWAARGANAESEHPWGKDDIGDQVCWSGKNKRELPCEVGAFPKGQSPQGVQDLIGGVFEWTTSKADPSSGIRYVRGGSWKDGDKSLFTVQRHGVFKPTYRCGFVGIRCAKALP